VDGGENVVPLAEEAILPRGDRRRTRVTHVGRADSREDLEEAADVLRGALVDDVDVERHDRGSLSDGGDPPDDDEPDVSVGQGPEEVRRVHGLS
jgi:hypothetical protein